jgi:hypothetical protein
MPRSKNKRQPRRQRRGRNNNNTILTAPMVPRNLRGSYPFPESRIVKLNAIFNFDLAAAATFVVRDFRLNSLFNFDVSGGSNDFSGTTQLAAIYDSYHVQKASVNFELSGNESGQPVLFGLTFKDDQPSTSITTFAKAVNSLEVAPTTGPIMVGQTTGQPIYRSRTYSINGGAIVGNTISYASDLSYTASFGSNPNQAIWMSCVAYTGGASNISNGVIVMLRVTLTVRVYSLKTLQE